MIPMTPEEAKAYFPIHIKVLKPNPLKLKYLCMAPPKWGKTTLFCGAHNALLLAFEEGHGFINIPKIVIDAWNVPLSERGPETDEATGTKFASATEVMDALEAYCPYDFIIIDTVDEAVKMCSQYECTRAKIEHPSDGGDFGKGWDLYQTLPFRKFYNRIVKLGVGVALLTHVNEEWKKDRYKQEVFRRETTLPKGIQKFVHAQSDVIMNGIWGNWRKGLSFKDRLVSFEASNEILAGTRIRGIHVPNEYIVTPPEDEDLSLPWKQWQSFFDDHPTAGQEADLAYRTAYNKPKPETVATTTITTISKPVSNPLDTESPELYTEESKHAKTNQTPIQPVQPTHARTQAYPASKTATTTRRT